MTADAPTIVATSGGIVPGSRTRFAFSPLTDHAVELAGVVGRAPRVCFLATASGDNPAVLTWLYEAAILAGFHASHLRASACRTCRTRPHICSSRTWSG